MLVKLTTTWRVKLTLGFLNAFFLFGVYGDILVGDYLSLAISIPVEFWTIYLIGIFNDYQ